MWPFTESQAVVEAPGESPAEKRERLHREWRQAELDFNAAFDALAKHDAKRPHLDSARARAAERRNRLLAEIAALPKEANRG